MIYTFDITPIAAPRMTQRDKWENTRTKRADNYLVYKRDIQMLCLQNKFKPTDNMRIIFYIPGINIDPFLISPPHKKKPDIDNMVKGFLDSVFENDSTVWHIDAYKCWTYEKHGRIEVEHL